VTRSQVKESKHAPQPPIQRNFHGGMAPPPLNWKKKMFNTLPHLRQFKSTKFKYKIGITD